MNFIDLRAIDLNWLEGTDPLNDCCLHGGVYLKIGDNVVSDGHDNEWTVSTAAYNLLGTINKDHFLSDDRPLIPHCGHTMWPVETEPDGLYLVGCDIDIDWEIHHIEGKVIHKITDSAEVETELEDWRSAVCEFSDEVLNFFMTSWPKIIPDKYEREGFELFMSKWRSRRDAADDK
jgi:hypothetical protein